jgi:hypothetical protein
MKAITYKITHNQHAISKALAGALLICLALYSALVCMVVFDTVDRRNIEKETQSLYSRVGKLEADYITRATNINLSFAHSIGFEDASRIKFTTRTTVVGIRDNLNNEI